MTAVQSYGRRTFDSLSVRNYRLYFIGQGISMSGSWMQSVAQGLLVLKLTGSGTALGLVIALQTLPILIFGPWGGIVADRYPKRTILYATQAASCILGTGVGLLVVTDLIRLWMVYVVGILLGVVTLFDNPARGTFVRELVGNDRLANAISLSATEMNLTRVIGPSFAGVLAATVGLGACFLFDGLSYIAVLISLYLMRGSELMPSVRVAGGKGQVQAGLQYVRTSPLLRNILIMMAIIGMLTYEFSVMLPLMGEFTFHRGPGAYASMTAAMGAGAVVGGLFTASRKVQSSPRMVGLTGMAFGASVLLTSIAPSLPLAIVALLIVGFFNINFTSLANVTLQLNAKPSMQGRVMALWSMAFLGTTPIGGPVMGAIGEHAGARVALAVAGLAAVGSAAWATWANRQAEVETATTGNVFDIDPAMDSLE
jgi:MFS family permease